MLSDVATIPTVLYRKHNLNYDYITSATDRVTFYLGLSEKNNQTDMKYIIILSEANL